MQPDVSLTARRIVEVLVVLTGVVVGVLQLIAATTGGRRGVLSLGLRDHVSTTHPPKTQPGHGEKKAA